jgi:hypothetical protein
MSSSKVVGVVGSEYYFSMKKSFSETLIKNNVLITYVGIPDGVDPVPADVGSPGRL